MRAARRARFRSRPDTYDSRSSASCSRSPARWPPTSASCTSTAGRARRRPWTCAARFGPRPRCSRRGCSRSGWGSPPAPGCSTSRRCRSRRCRWSRPCWPAAMVLLAVMAERIFGLRIGRRQWIGLGADRVRADRCSASPCPPPTAPTHASRCPGMIAFEAALIAGGTLLIMGPRMGAPREHHGFMLGAAAGILFGVSDIAIKAISGLIGSGGADGSADPVAAGLPARLGRRRSTPRPRASRTATPCR